MLPPAKRDVSRSRTDCVSVSVSSRRFDAKSVAVDFNSSLPYALPEAPLFRENRPGVRSSRLHRFLRLDGNWLESRFGLTGQHQDCRQNSDQADDNPPGRSTFPCGPGAGRSSDVLAADRTLLSFFVDLRAARRALDQIDRIVIAPAVAVVVLVPLVVQSTPFPVSADQRSGRPSAVLLSAASLP